MTRAQITYLLAAGILAFPPSPTADFRTATFELASQDITGLTGPPKGAAWDTLNKGVEDGDADHRKKALAAAGTIVQNKQAVELVARGLKDKDIEVRQTAAAALGEMKSQDAVPDLQAALDDKPEVAFTAAKSLWELGDTSVRDFFQEVLEGERKNTPGKMESAKRMAKKKLRPDALALMGVKEATGVMFGPASFGITAMQEAIKEGKKDSGAPGRTVAAEILAKDSDPYALTMLEWSLGDDSWAVRVAVAKALGERGNIGTVPKLMPLLTDEHHGVRYMAAASIVRLSIKSQTRASIKPLIPSP
jgi:HEAT repeat protein